MNWCHNRRGSCKKKKKKSEIVIGWIMNRLICDGSLQDGRGKAICRQEAGWEIHLCQWQSPLTSYCSCHNYSRADSIRERLVQIEAHLFIFPHPLLLMAAFDTYWNNALSTRKPFWIIHAIASQSASDILVLQGSLMCHKIQCWVSEGTLWMSHTALS